MPLPLACAPAETPAAPFLNLGARPRVAVLREQGVNSHVEMAYAFTEAGFDAVDVHMTDRKSTRLNSSHLVISYAVFCLKKKNQIQNEPQLQDENAHNDQSVH